MLWIGNSMGLARLLLVGLFIVTFVGEAGAEESALPSSVQSHVKRIQAMLDQADSALEADRLTTAQRKVQDAEKALAELQRRYAGKFPEDHPDYTAMLDRLKTTTDRVEQVAAGAAEAAGQAAQAREENEALCQTWVDKLGPFVDHNSDKYLRIGSDLNSATPEEQAQCKAAFAEAKTLMAEYKNVTFPQGKTMALKNMESSLTSSMKYYQQEEDAALKDEACAPWIARLRPYVDLGAGNDKLLIASATVDPEQIKTQQTIYEEAKAAYETYLNTAFPLGKSWEMERVAAELARRLEAFPDAMAESMAMMSGDIGKRLDSVLNYLNRDTAWHSDMSKKPPTIMQRDLEPLHEELRKLIGTGSADEARITELKTKLQSIEEINTSHRQVCSERTYQSPDAFTGPELDDLKAKAVEVLRAQYPKAQVLRTTVPSKAWAVEDVIEATDTTNTAIRRRITRSVRAQLAIKRDDGKVYLQEVYLGQDKQPEGWGELKGHTTWSDWMQEANVNKEAPK